jgi:hypothetical protein
MAQSKIDQGLKRWAFLLISVLGLLMVSFGTARAIFYPAIDTDDGTVDDWIDVFAAGEFSTDPPGDVANPQEDLINAWVSSTGDTSTDKINFFIAVIGPNALNGHERAALALFDCNLNGVMEQDWDAAIFYDRFNNSIPGNNWQDQVVICNGEFQTCTPIGDPFFGQIIGESNEFVEWGVQIGDLPPNELSHQDANCQDLDINIKLATLDFTWNDTKFIDESDYGFLRYYMPTAIELHHFGVESGPWSIISILIVGRAMTLIGFGGYILVHRTSSSTSSANDR